VLNETADANPEGVELPSLFDVQPLQGGVVNWSQPRVPLGASPVAIQLIPSGDAVKLRAKYVIEFMKRTT
jgi:hypothetical protein